MTDQPKATCPNLTRRKFLGALGASVAVAAAGTYGISVWGRNPDGTGIPSVGSVSATTTTAGAAAIPVGPVSTGIERILIVIEMGGGNDGLNTVIPHASGRYFDLRGDLAIDEPLDLDGQIGLHPELKFVAERFGMGQVGIIEGVGYPDPDLSHFASMATWWAGSANEGTSTGWLGRYLDSTTGADDPLAGITIGPGPTPALLGDTAFQINVQDTSGLSPRIPEWIDSRKELSGLWRGFAPARFDGVASLDTVRSAIAVSVTAQSTVNELLGAPGLAAPATAREGRRSDLEQSVEVAAALIASPVAPRVVYIHGWGDFDTHEGQQARHGDMMLQLDAALVRLFAAAESAGVDERLTVITTSEFGRRPAFNGSGTDHGTANSHFIIGPGVAGGRYGEAPSLTNLDGRGNLVHTVDYRSVYASILEDWLQAPADELLGGSFETLPVFRT